MLKGMPDEYAMKIYHLAIQHKYFQRKISVKFQLQYLYEEMSFFLCDLLMSESWEYTGHSKHWPFVPKISFSH